MDNSSTRRNYLDGAIALLMLEEEQHRTANELAGAMAHLRRSAAASPPDRAHLDKALLRLEGFARTRRLLCTPEVDRCDLSSLMRSLADATTLGRDADCAQQISVPPHRVTVMPQLARIMLRLSHELMVNAHKHAEPGTPALIEFRATRNRLLLRSVNAMRAGRTIANDGSGMRIMRATCDERGGSLRRSIHAGVFEVRISLPRLPRPDS